MIKGGKRYVEIYPHSGYEFDKMIADYGAWMSHREARTTCPHCDYNTTLRKHDEWMNNIVEIVLWPEKLFKTDSLLIVCACPMCEKRSWEHLSLSYLTTFKDDLEIRFDVSKIEDEKKYRIQETKKEWEESLCKDCVWLVDYNISLYSSQVKCKSPEANSIGPPRSVKQGCEKYRKCEK